MSYSSHAGSAGLGLAEVPPVAGGKGATRLGGVVLAVVVMSWVGFGLAMWAAPELLLDIWEWVGGLSIAAELVFWILGLPWMLALAVWQTAWPAGVQVALIAGIALFSVRTFYPKRTV